MSKGHNEQITYNGMVWEENFKQEMLNEFNRNVEYNNEYSLMHKQKESQKT